MHKEKERAVVWGVKGDVGSWLRSSVGQTLAQWGPRWQLSCVASPMRLWALPLRTQEGLSLSFFKKPPPWGWMTDMNYSLTISFGHKFLFLDFSKSNGIKYSYSKLVSDMTIAVSIGHLPTQLREGKPPASL
jgi:hypothetical protein